jgi:hypothetical protein
MGNEYLVEALEETLKVKEEKLKYYAEQMVKINSEIDKVKVGIKGLK